MSNLDIDVIVPVHTATRPIRRAVRSALEGTNASVRVNVVAHNIDPHVIERNLAELAQDPRVRLLPFADGIPSPSGPMNHALDEASAAFFALLGSDDEFAPGALDSWLAMARRTRSDVVLARIDRLDSGFDRTPPTRRGRTEGLDPARDRLAYRCAPLGLVSRRRFGDLRFTPGLHSGEDLEFTAALWFTGATIAYDRMTPGYVGHEDEADRVTFTARNVDEDFKFLQAIRDSDWFPGLSRAERTALGVKTVRLHFYDAVYHRLRAPGGFDSVRSDLLGVLDDIASMFPGSIRLLSRADRKVIDELRRSHSDPEVIEALIAARWSGGIQALLPRNPLLTLHSQAPFRTLRAMRA